MNKREISPLRHDYISRIYQVPEAFSAVIILRYLQYQITALCESILS